MTQTLTTRNQIASQIEKAIFKIDPMLGALLDLEMICPTSDSSQVLAVGFEADGYEDEFGGLPVVLVGGHDVALGEPTFEAPTAADTKVQLELFIDYTDLREVRIVDNDAFVIAANIRHMLTEAF